jgi:hypothetical protein
MKEDSRKKGRQEENGFHVEWTNKDGGECVMEEHSGKKEDRKKMEFMSIRNK